VKYGYTRGIDIWYHWTPYWRCCVCILLPRVCPKVSYDKYV